MRPELDKRKPDGYFRNAIDVFRKAQRKYLCVMSEKEVFQVKSFSKLFLNLVNFSVFSIFFSSNFFLVIFFVNFSVIFPGVQFQRRSTNASTPTYPKLSMTQTNFSSVNPKDLHLPKRRPKNYWLRKATSPRRKKFWLEKVYLWYFVTRDPFALLVKSWGNDSSSIIQRGSLIIGKV